MRTTDLLPKGIGVHSARRDRLVLETSDGRDGLVALGAPGSMDPRKVGAKAAVLARATVAGFNVLPGFVITTGASDQIISSGDLRTAGPLLDEIRSAWRLLSHDGTRTLIVRSSSTAEDGDDSSMAGMFSSISGVRGWDAFLEAVTRVLESRKIIDLGARTMESAPIAVLIQPQLELEVGGIMFGVDPVTGDRDRLTVVAARGGPEVLVSGREEGQPYVLSRSGRVLNRDEIEDRLLSLKQRRALAALAAKAETAFKGPQDNEWAIGSDGTIYLFQSRPVTAVASAAEGPILGPGPVAETFPDPLGPLETDLWVVPLRSGIEIAFGLSGAASRKRVSRSAVVTTVGGRVVADLDLFGIAPTKRSLWSRLDPIPPARRVAAAWRVGRLRAALPRLAEEITREIDARLSQVPDLREITNDKLLSILVQTQRTLISLHGYEVLCGMLDPEENETSTGAAIALRALALGRLEGFEGEAILAQSPEVLALMPPSITGNGALPETSAMTLACDSPDTDLGPRESLRLRIRWVQELAARAARELGKRMVPAGHLQKSGDIALLSLDEVRAMVVSGVSPASVESRTVPASAPLPGAFRLTATGAIVPVQIGRSGNGARGAGGGRSMGKICHGTQPAHGDVLVVRTLDPALAPLLPSLGGLIAETGNVLSHLAILAREFGVPTVVGYEDALETFSEGTVVVIDGATGEVTEVTSP